MRASRPPPVSPPCGAGRRRAVPARRPTSGTAGGRCARSTRRPAGTRPVIRSRPYPPRRSSATVTLAGPSTASTRRSSTTQARIGGHREGFPALDPAVADPAAAPDQRPGLVVTAPDVPRVGRRDRVPAGSAEQPAERGRAVPARHAQPRDRPVRPDKRAALPVRDKRVLPQHPRGQHVARPSAVNTATSSHGVLTSSLPALPCARRAASARTRVADMTLHTGRPCRFV